MYLASEMLSNISSGGDARVEKAPSQGRGYSPKKQVSLGILCMSVSGERQKNRMLLLGSLPVAGSSLNSALECNRFMLEQTFFEGRVYFGGNDRTMTILSSLSSLKHLCYTYFIM